MKIASHQYGKQKVRVMKILREGAVHTIKELTVSVALQGDFQSSYIAGDNRLVVATDTMKNTVQALAKDHLGLETERFLAFLGQHFLEKYPQIEVATLRADERTWGRLEIEGRPHPHAFTAHDKVVPFTKAIASAAGMEIHSGIKDLVLMKSTESSFTDYPRCEFTNLPESLDRVLATSLTASWKWSAIPPNYPFANAAILRAMLVPFANHHSPSAQTTLFEMGTAALDCCPQIAEIQLAMPNQHFIPISLEPFGMTNQNEIFLPTDEPHGLIEATLVRTN